jgi:hypothetical protein
MEVRASVDNCAAGAEATAASATTGIKTRKRAFNESILYCTVDLAPEERESEANSWTLERFSN